MVDLKHYPEDEIPGWTGYIYSEHRYRESHEYINSWKWEEKTTSIEEDLLLQSHSRSDLVRLISELDKDRKNIRNEYEDRLKGQLDLQKDMQKKFDFFESENVHLERKIKDSNKDLNTMTKTNGTLIKYIRNFGYHTIDCTLVELASSGRILDQKEEDLCTCGWCKTRQDVT